MREVLRPFRYHVVNGPWDKFMELCLQIYKSLLLVLFLLAQPWLEKITPLNLWWKVWIDAEGLYSQ